MICFEVESWLSPERISTLRQLSCEPCYSVGFICWRAHHGEVYQMRFFAPLSHCRVQPLVELFRLISFCSARASHVSFWRFIIYHWVITNVVLHVTSVSYSFNSQKKVLTESHFTAAIRAGFFHCAVFRTWTWRAAGFNDDADNSLDERTLFFWWKWNN